MSDLNVVKVNPRYRITLPEPVCTRLNIQTGDSLLVDIQAGAIILQPRPRDYMEHLTGRHAEIWRQDVATYLKKERGQWKRSTNG